MSDNRAYRLTGESVRAIREDHRRFNQLLSDIPEVKRRVIDGSVLADYIVTEKQTDPILGVGENIAIGKDFERPNLDPGAAPVFKARPYKMGAVSLTDLDGDEIYVHARFIQGAIFTGQMFLMCPADNVSNISSKFRPDGDVIAAGDGSQWVASYVGMQGSLVKCDLQIDVKVTNQTASETRLRTCRILAANLVDATFDAGQTLYITRFAKALGSTSFAVINYACPT